ncbi:putative membrane protein [Bhargavaea cecembensis DSE10]|uniref:Putative membrane protein n=1 Tax=Bhargavaea cecembensis DSE10 TaxID=1235279 RepID=M7NUE7_9BACL|nr:VWA domain-containing protein [Bhargavaea cecembensis]EMR05260.1 putative membrane protein [Bhargavaea cecembensis DSE10]
MDFRIEDPVYLLLLLPVLGYLFWSWNRERIRNGRKALVLLILRILASVLLIIAAASPYLLMRAGEERVFFLVDRSASMEGSEEETSAFLSGAIGRHPDRDVTVLSFAGEVSNDLPESGSAGETDLESALRYAGAAAAGHPARIVVLSDGRETKGDALGYVRSQLPAGVTVDAAVVAAPAAEDVSVSSFTVPTTGRKGESQQLEVTIRSTAPAVARLVLFRNDQPIAERDMDLAEGENRFTFSDLQVEEGLVKYEAQVIMEGDGIQENNRMAAVTEIEGPPRVLIAETAGDPSPLGELIGKNGVSTQTVRADNLPRDLSSYLQYDAVIFDNVPGHLVGEGRMKVIEQAVKTFGLGFMMVGGEESFGLGGYFRTPIEDMLPVDLDVTGKQVIPSLGLVIVMDRSSSMSGRKLDLAKEAAARSAALLREDDMLGFIAFDNSPWEVIEPSPLDDPDEATGKIMSVTPGGGTNIYPAVALAYERLRGLDLERKHIILLTDGMSAPSGNYASLAEAGDADGVTMSTVAIGTDADRRLLQQLAEQASGRYYEVTDADSVPSILSRETAMLSRTYIVDEPFTPAVRGGTEWDALFRNGLPQINAYIATTAKPASEVILESPQEDPIIAEGRYGLGRTLAYTSGSGAWSGGFPSWDRWGELWTTAVSRILPQYRSEPFDIRRNTDGSYTVTGSASMPFLDIAVADEKGRELGTAVEPVRPGTARVRIQSGPGLFFFRISGDGENVSTAGITIPYGDEYRPGPPDAEHLAAIAEASGGRVLESAEEALRPPESSKKDILPAWDWFALAAMLVFFADITLRRFGMPRIRKPGRASKRLGDAAVNRDETSVEKLLKAKKQDQ